MRAPTMQDLFDISLAFAYQPLPTGKRLAIVTNAGGPGIMATDACERKGLRLAELRAGDDRAACASNLPRSANVYNPVDVIGDAQADRYEVAIDAALADPNVDALLVLLTPQAMTEIEKTAEATVRAGQQRHEAGARRLHGRRGRRTRAAHPQGRARAQLHLPRAGGGSAGGDEPLSRLEAEPRGAARAHRGRPRGGRGGDRQGARRPAAPRWASWRRAAWSRPTACGCPATSWPQSPDEAVEFAGQIGYPVVMKIVSPDILHKSDIGGVRVGVQGRRRG